MFTLVRLIPCLCILFLLAVTFPYAFLLLVFVAVAGKLCRFAWKVAEVKAILYFSQERPR